MIDATPDALPVIESASEVEGLDIAAGFSGHGYKFCGVVGEILADLATEGATDHPIDLFSPARLANATRG